MDGQRVKNFSIVGGLLGVLPALPAALFSALWATGDGSRDISELQFAWALFSGAFPVIAVCAGLGALFGLATSTSQRSIHSGQGSESSPPEKEQGFLWRRPGALFGGLALIALLLWAAPRLLIYPSIGTALVWTVARVKGWHTTAASLLVGGMIGSFAHYWLTASSQKVAMLSYFMRWGALGIIIAIVVGMMPVLGPTLFFLALSPSQKPVQRAA